MKKLTLIAAMTASIFAINAQAEGLYVEGGLGQSKLEMDSQSEKGTSFSGTVGYEFLDLGQLQISGEANYNRYADIQDLDSVDGFDVNMNISSIGLGTKLNFQPVDKVNLFGRLGYEKVTAEVELKSDLAPGVTVSNEDVQHSMTYALGGAYDVNKNFALGTQYKYSKLENDLDLSNMSLFATYSF